MTAQQYRRIFAWFNARPAAKQALRLCQSGSVLAVYLIYLGMLTVLAWQRDARLLPVVAAPAFVFLSGTVLRRVINRPRPYEALHFSPLFPKNTRGKSMPSRHCFSAAAIAAAAWTVCPPLGAAAVVLALLIAGTRVLTGVHYPGDVLAGLLYGGAAAALILAILL